MSEAITFLKGTMFDIYYMGRGYTNAGQYTEQGFKDENGTRITATTGSKLNNVISLISNANGGITKASGGYINGNFIPSARALTKEDIDEATGNTGSYNCTTYYNGLFAVPAGSNYAQTWLATASGSSLWAVMSSGIIGGNGPVSLGVRPVITIDSSVKYIFNSIDNNGISIWNINE